MINFGCHRFSLQLYAVFWFLLSGMAPLRSLHYSHRQLGAKAHVHVHVWNIHVHVQMWITWGKVLQKQTSKTMFEVSWDPQDEMYLTYGEYYAVLAHDPLSSGCCKCQMCFSQKLLPVLLWYPYYARKMEKIAIIPPFTKAAVEIPFGFFHLLPSLAGKPKGEGWSPLSPVRKIFLSSASYPDMLMAKVTFFQRSNWIHSHKGTFSMEFDRHTNTLSLLKARQQETSYCSIIPKLMSSSRLFSWLTTALMQLWNTDSKDRVCLCLPSKSCWPYPEPSSPQDSVNWGGRDAMWMIKPDVPTTTTIKKGFQCTIFMVIFFFLQLLCHL